MDSTNISRPALEALQTLANSCVENDIDFRRRCEGGQWVLAIVFPSLFFMIAVIVFVLRPSRFDKIWDEIRNDIRNEITEELRNIPSHQLHQRLESMYQGRVGIKTQSLREVKRYPTVTFVDDPVTMKRTITVVEDLAWVLPVKGEKNRKTRNERELTREEEEVGLTLQELGLENDQEAKPGNGIRRGDSDEPPRYDEDGELLRFRGRVNP